MSLSLCEKVLKGLKYDLKQANKAAACVHCSVFVYKVQCMSATWIFRWTFFCKSLLDITRHMQQAHK